MAPIIRTPTSFVDLVLPRDLFDDDDCGWFDHNCDNRSSWDRWGRWVALGVIVVFAVLIALFTSCLANRRRRRQGLHPMPGTAWMPYANGLGPGLAPPPAYSQADGARNNNFAMGSPHGEMPPKYAGGPVDAQQTGTTFTGEEGYYGNHGRNSPTMSPPSATMGLQEPPNVYAAPARAEMAGAGSPFPQEKA